MFVRIIYSIFFILFGIVVLKYRKQVKSWTGDFLWAERYLGRGGTYLVLIFIGLGAIFVGIIYPLGGFDILYSRNIK